MRRMDKRSNRNVQWTIGLTLALVATVAAIIGINASSADTTLTGSMQKAYAEEDDNIRTQEYGGQAPLQSLQSPTAGTVAADGQRNNNNDNNNLGFANPEERDNGNGNEHAENNNNFGANNVANLVLLGTVAVIAIVGGYAGYQLLKIKQISNKLRRNINSPT